MLKNRKKVIEQAKKKCVCRLKQTSVIEEELERYLVSFEKKYGRMLPNVYPFDCKIAVETGRAEIVITHNECTFSSNAGLLFE